MYMCVNFTKYEERPLVILIKKQEMFIQCIWNLFIGGQLLLPLVAVHLGVKMADTLSFTAKVDMVDF